MNKAKEILYKHAENNGCKSVLSRNPYLEQMVLNAINEALTIPVDVGQSEQLFCYSCQAWTEHKNATEKNYRCTMCGNMKAK